MKAGSVRKLKGFQQNILRRHHLRWIGHMAKMDVSRMPKTVLFGELEKARTCQRRMKYLAVADLEAAGVKGHGRR